VPAARKSAAPLRHASRGDVDAGPVRRMQAALVTAVNADNDWKEF
jgi:hypothetical protein